MREDRKRAELDIPPAVRQQIKKRARSKEESDEDELAYRTFVDRLRSTRDIFTRRVIEQTLDFAISQSDMRLSYVFEGVLSQTIAEQRKARRKLQPFLLYAEIERILSRSILTAVGHSRRYPLQTTAAYSKTKRLPRNATASEDNVLPANFRGSFYTLGSHSFRVGEAVEKIVDMLEDRYGLDFQKLENRLQKSQKN